VACKRSEAKSTSSIEPSAVGGRSFHKYRTSDGECDCDFSVETRLCHSYVTINQISRMAGPSIDIENWWGVRGTCGHMYIHPHILCKCLPTVRVHNTYYSTKVWTHPPEHIANLTYGSRIHASMDPSMMISMEVHMYKYVPHPSHGSYRTTTGRHVTSSYVSRKAEEETGSRLLIVHFGPSAAHSSFSLHQALYPSYMPSRSVVS
jgi:hypothetical protein